MKITNLKKIFLKNWFLQTCDQSLWNISVLGLKHFTYPFQNFYINLALDAFTTHFRCLSKIIRNTAQKMKFSITDFFSKCDQIRSFLRIWPYLLRKSVMENFIFCAVKCLLARHCERAFNLLSSNNLMTHFEYLEKF